jgi:hypothetical protein
MGRVFAEEVVNIIASRNSFQTRTNEKAMAPKIWKRAIGRAIRKKVAYGPSPSTRAASSTCRLTRSKAGTDSQMVIDAVTMR